MRCEKVWEILEEVRTDEVPVPVREHLARCSACQAFGRDWRLVRAGFRALAEEPMPEATLGFAARVVRRLEDPADRGVARTEFLERTGRRVVYATFLLALTVLLALVLPSSGPLRGPSAEELLVPQLDAAASGIDPVFAEDSLEIYEPPSFNPLSGFERKRK